MKLKLLTLASALAFMPAMYAQVDPYNVDPNPPAEIPGYKLAWSDEFNYEGKPSSANWSFETGFVRNEEHQWYQEGNALCKDGALQIVGKRERVKNPNYKAGSSNWKENRQYAEYTSSAIHTRGKKSWKFGRFEIRAKIPATPGAWPAIWTLGDWKEWPCNGEIDIMEYYGNGILANACWGSPTRWSATWDSSKTPMSHFTNKDADWVNKYHIWVMDWTPDYIKLYLDGELLNTIETAKTVNPQGSADPGSNPFKGGWGQHVLLNLALGGVNGGDPSRPNYPITYYVDYFRVYQVDANNTGCFQPLDKDKNLAPNPACDKVRPDGTGERSRSMNNMKVYCGQYSGQIDGGTYLQKISWEAGKSYRVRTMVYANGADVALSATGFGEGNDIDRKIENNLQQWQQVEFVFTAPQNADSEGGLSLSGAAGSMIDNVEVYELADSFVEISRNKLHFDKTNSVKTFNITAYQLTETLTLTAPAGVTLSQNTITAAQAENGQTITVTYDKATDVNNKYIEIKNAQYTGRVGLSSSAREYESDNLAVDWDARGNVGAGSEPNNWGWVANGSIVWKQANQTSDVRYTDQGASTQYTLNGEKFQGRLLHTRWDGGVAPENCYAFPVELEAGKLYTFSGLVGWQANANDYAIYTVGVNSDKNNQGISYARIDKTIAKADLYKLYNFTLTFMVPQDGTYYLTFTNTNKIMGAVGDLKLREGLQLPAKMQTNRTNLTLTETVKTMNLFISGENLKENIVLTSPPNVTLDKYEINTDDINGKTNVLVKVEFDGLRDIENENIELVSGDIRKSVSVKATAFQTSIEGELSESTNFNCYFEQDNLVFNFYAPMQDEVKFYLYNVGGMLVAQNSTGWTVQGNQTEKVNISIPSGTYLVQLVTKNKSTVKKIFKF